MQQQRADRIRICVKQIIQIRLIDVFHCLVTAGRIQVSIETSVPTAANIQASDQKIDASAGAAPAPRYHHPAVAVAIEARKVLRFAIVKFL